MKAMKVYVVNGSPRKNFNIASLLQSFKDGILATVPSAAIKEVALYDYKYTGCRECYLCKMKGGKFYGQCGFRDEITDILGEIAQADVLAIGAPVFIGDFNAQTKAFLERLFFPFISYAGPDYSFIAPKKIHTAFFSAMNVKPETRQQEYDPRMNNTLQYMEYVFGHKPEVCYAHNTSQFKDYANYEAGLWDVEDKQKWREEELPKTIKEAFAIGQRLAGVARNEKE